ncbi:MAG: hypothetical protein EOO09_04705 [Chitinophagaceae bacterium]|nr:MAG: hypothetical protein EOO09_04705 [Chitinophagaceae bacterium]
MTNKISTYKDLIEEKERLQTLLSHQKEVLRDDIRGIKEEFEPVRAAAGFVGKFFKKDKTNPLLNIASNRVINLVVKNLFLRNAGWFTRLAVPFLAKNFSSHVLAGNKTQILGKLASWFNKLRGHKVKHEDHEASPEYY